MPFQIVKTWDSTAVRGGNQGVLVRLPNGIEVSIIRGDYSYAGLFEVRVSGEEIHGLLTKDELTELLRELSQRDA